MKSLVSWGGLALVLVLFVAFNVTTDATLSKSRVDLTENKLYTLSDGTKNVLRNLQEPVTLRFYFSKKLANEDREARGIVSYAQRVRELLQEYESVAAGKVTLEVADPEPYSETEEKAVTYGLKGIPTSSGDNLFFGLAGTAASSKEDQVIEFFSPDREESLEYDVTRLVYQLANPKKRVVGVLSSLPVDGDPMARMMNPRAPAPEPYVVVDQLRQTYDVKVIPATAKELDKGLDVLVIAHPQNLAPSMLYSIDQFVLGGGKVIAFVDPYCESQQVRNDPQNPMAALTADRTSSLGALADTWGFEMPGDQIVADKDLALRIPTGQGQPPADMVIYLGLTSAKDALSKDDFTTSQLDHLNLLSAGALRRKEGATTSFTPILETTKNSMKIEKSRIQFGPNPAELLESFSSGGEKLTLAARISGPAKTAFPEGKPKSEDTSTPPAAEVPQLKESNGPINVIVVADADLLNDGTWVQAQNLLGMRMLRTFADNGTFVLNAVENLSGSNDLISLRSRGKSLRPFDRVVELRREAEARNRIKEKDLQAKKDQAEENISKLQGNKDPKSALILTAEQQAEVEKFREELAKTRTEMRKVKLDSLKDIESLKSKLVAANGFAVPLVVLAIGIVVWLTRRAKMKAARERAA